MMKRGGEGKPRRIAQSVGRGGREQSRVAPWPRWPGSVDARAARHVKLKRENSSATGAGDRRAGPPRPSRSRQAPPPRDVFVP